MDQPDPIPLSALLGRLGPGLDNEAQKMRGEVLSRYNAMRELMDALEHVSGVNDWDLQVTVVDALEKHVTLFKEEFHRYAKKRKQLDLEESNAKHQQ